MAKAKQEEKNPDDVYAAAEGAAHMRARAIAVDILGPLGNPDKPEEYAPPFSVIHNVRKRCIFVLNEDGDLDDDLIEEMTVDLRFAISWAQPIVGRPLTVAEAFEAFDALNTEPDLEEKVDEIYEKVIE